MTYSVTYNAVTSDWDVIDRDGIVVTSFTYEENAASYCDHLNENDY